MGRTHPILLAHLAALSAPVHLLLQLDLGVPPIRPIPSENDDLNFTQENNGGSTEKKPVSSINDGNSRNNGNRSSVATVSSDPIGNNPNGSGGTPVVIV